MEYHIRTLDQLRPILVGFRKQAGLSQMAVAALLGVSQQSYAKIEANPAVTSVERLFKIIGLLGGEIVLSERTPGLGGNLAQHLTDSANTQRVPPQPGPDKPEVSPSLKATQKSGKKGRRIAAAPDKLLPPSKKTESW